MPAPAEGITLDDKLAVTRHLSAAGANIKELNTVRKQLSRIKGGGLIQASAAGQFVSLIISDVLGDPLDVIASGPTVPDSSHTTRSNRSTPAIRYSKRGHFTGGDSNISQRRAGRRPALAVTPTRRVQNVVIGNNAAGRRRRGLGSRAAGIFTCDDLGREVRRPGGTGGPPTWLKWPSRCAAARDRTA